MGGIDLGSGIPGMDQGSGGLSSNGGSSSQDLSASAQPQNSASGSKSEKKEDAKDEDVMKGYMDMVKGVNGSVTSALMGPMSSDTLSGPSDIMSGEDGSHDKQAKAKNQSSNIIQKVAEDPELAAAVVEM